MPRMHPFLASARNSVAVCGICSTHQRARRQSSSCGVMCCSWAQCAALTVMLCITVQSQCASSLGSAGPSSGARPLRHTLGADAYAACTKLIKAHEQHPQLSTAAVGAASAAAALAARLEHSHRSHGILLAARASIQVPSTCTCP